ncbi:unnamed protein product [Fusarium graminearum]|nr:unnamed protein product [Fusarium graminearum]CAG1970625.1 unnamed protein product [Fusarium graminearum]VTO86838.1 unnamed protein product [Fusarium graminearum]
MKGKPCEATVEGAHVLRLDRYPFDLSDESDVLGLVALEDKDVDSPPLVELEIGRSTIALDINPEPEDAWIHVVWQFGTELGEHTTISIRSRSIILILGQDLLGSRLFLRSTRLLTNFRVTITSIDTSARTSRAHEEN